jgi:hypothetical protein
MYARAEPSSSFDDATSGSSPATLKPSWNPSLKAATVSAVIGTFLPVDLEVSVHGCLRPMFAAKARCVVGFPFTRPAVMSA